MWLKNMVINLEVASTRLRPLCGQIYCVIGYRNHSEAFREKSEFFPFVLTLFKRVLSEEEEQNPFKIEQVKLRSSGVLI